jgi:hypothetical protein
MIETVFVIVMLSVLAGLALIAFLIWTFRDGILYLFEILGYVLQSVGKVVVQGAVELLQALDELLVDFDIADQPMLRLIVIGVVGLGVGVGIVALLAMVLGTPWVIITLTLATAIGMAVGLIADPDKDWSIGPFPSFPRRGGGGPKLPLNL